MTVLRKAVVMALFLMGLSTTAQGQEFVADACRPLLPASAVRYDTPEHSRWYRRFWTGDCDHLLACLPGSPNWNEILGKLLVRGGSSERATLLPKACRLGQMVGLDWSRERNIRHISTADLKVLYRALEAAKDPIKGVEQAEAAARAKLAH